MDFASEYESFIQSHIRRRTGERRRRLKDGHGLSERIFVEKVWWPAFGHFDGLHPEYEVFDFKDGYRYIDFAYIHEHFRVAIEIDGLGTHWRNITQWQFSDHLQRQNHLVIDGWHVLRFPFEEVDQRPRLCQQTVHQLMGRLLGGTTLDMSTLSVLDREIVRFLVRALKPVTPSQVADSLRISSDAAIRHLHQLIDEEWVQPASGFARVRSYKLHSTKQGIQI